MARILIAEDDAFFRDFLAVTVERNGHQAVTLPNGREVLEIVGQLDIDLVVTDLFMPEVDGIEVARTLHHRYPDLPVVVMTGTDLDAHGGYLRSAISIFSTAALSKSTPARELSARIEDLLAGPQPRATAG